MCDSKRMYKRNSRRGNSRRGGSGYKSSNRKGGYSRGRNNNRRRQPKVSFDSSQFIKKAVPAEDTKVFTPKHLFEDFQIHQKIKENIKRKKYVSPSPIQDGIIPQMLLGKDVIGIANTGTGKTAAFLIPLVDKVIRNKKSKVLILSPTRELALQTDQEFREFSRGTGIRSAICIGGAGMGGQISQLRKNPNFIIGTPGRLKDLVERKILNLKDVDSVVLDEVDRMLDMGFVKDIKFLLSLTQNEKQSSFFSATFDKGTKELAMKFLKNPVSVSIEARATSENVDQDVVYVKNADEKIDLLHDILLKEECKKVIVFGKTKHGVDKLGKNLSQRGFKAGSIHGNMSQNKRQKVLRFFKENRINVMFATDVAARGLDIDDITHVINYDLPSNYEDYIHRIGRTGRGSKTGSALTFIEKYNKK